MKVTKVLSNYPSVDYPGEVGAIVLDEESSQECLIYFGSEESFRDFEKNLLEKGSLTIYEKDRS